MAIDLVSAVGNYLLGEGIDVAAEETGLKKRARGILSELANALIPEAAASDASTIPQNVPPVPPVPDVVNNEGSGANILPIESGRSAPPQIQQASPARLPDIQMGQTPEEKAAATQQFVRDNTVPNGNVKAGNTFFTVAPETLEMLDPQGPVTSMNIDEARKIVRAGDFVFNKMPKIKQVAEETGDDSIFDAFGQKVKDYFGSEENMTRLALAFNSMRLQPDQGLATVLGKRLETLSAQRDRQKMAMSGNQTMKLLDKYPDLKAAYLSGQMTLKDVLTNINAMRRLEIDEGKPAGFRALEARAEAAGLKPGTDAYNQFMINGGQRKGMSLRVNKDGSIEMVEGGDLSSLTETQSNALVFSQRMKEANSILDKVEMQGADFLQTMMQKVPVAGNYLISEEQQSYQQAKENFINATLRKESGAAIADSEFTRADKQYFPTPGDSPQVIAQKRANRELAQKLIESGVPNVNKIVEKSGADVGAGAETLDSQPKTQKPPITPEQARAELARRRGQ
jgi:hypothetical protein